MGKNFCKVEGKWCKLLKRGVCGFSKKLIDDINECPKVKSIETVRLFDLLKQVDFPIVYNAILKWWPEEERNKDGYKEVFENLLKMTPKKHNLSDLFISVKVVSEDGKDYLDTTGVDITSSRKNVSYAIEFIPWEDWISMFITENTLSTLSQEDIVAGCLYEMTFCGFDQRGIQEKKQKLKDAIKEYEAL